MYVGVDTEVSTGETIDLSVANLSNFFSVSTGSTTSTAWTISDDSTGKIKLVPGNFGVASSTATITLTAARALTNVVISGAYYTENNYDKISLTVAGTKVLSAVSGTSALADRYANGLGNGETIVLTYAKDSSQDAANESNTAFYISCDGISYGSSGTETKSIARRVKKIYVGVKGIARQAKKAFIGVANVARQFFGGYDSIQQVSNPTQFIKSSYNDSVNSASLNGVSAIALPGKYAMFAGSYTSNHVSSTYTYYASKYVYAVDKNLVVTEAANLAKYSAWLNPASLDNYAVFGGGYSSTSISNSSNTPSRASSDVCAYDANLTRHDLDSLYGSSASYNKPSAGNGKYAIYPRWGIGFSGTHYIDTYDENLIKNELSSTDLADRIGSIDACRFGSYAVFFGTVDGASSGANLTKSAYAYDQNLIKHSMSDLNDPRTSNYPGQCVAGTNYVVLGGGRTSNSSASSTNQYPRNLEVYDKNLIKISTDAKLSYNTEWCGTLAIDNWIIFCGGHHGSTNTGSSTSGTSSTVNMFDENLIRTIDTLTNGLYYIEGASIGDYGIAVGYGNSNNTVVFQGV